MRGARGSARIVRGPVVPRGNANLFRPGPPAVPIRWIHDAQEHT